MDAVILFDTFTDDGMEIRLEIPAAQEPCFRCQKVSFHELFDADVDERPDDAGCRLCGGLRVVPVPDERRCDPDTLARYRAHQQAEADARAAAIASRCEY